MTQQEPWHTITAFATPAVIARPTRPRQSKLVVTHVVRPWIATTLPVSR